MGLAVTLGRLFINGVLESVPPKTQLRDPVFTCPWASKNDHGYVINSDRLALLKSLRIRELQSTCFADSGTKVGYDSRERQKTELLGNLKRMIPHRSGTPTCNPHVHFSRVLPQR